MLGINLKNNLECFIYTSLGRENLGHVKDIIDVFMIVSTLVSDKVLVEVRDEVR